MTFMTLNGPSDDDEVMAIPKTFNRTLLCS